MVKKTKSVSGDVAPKQEFQIIKALDSVMRAAHHCFGGDDDLECDAPAKGLGLEGDRMKTVEAELEFLTEKLSMTRMQLVIIGMLIDFNGALASINMAGFFGMSNLSFLAYQSELEDLISRRLIRTYTDHKERQVYQIRPEVLKAYLKNEVYKPSSYKNLSLQDFIDAFNKLMEDSRSDELSNAEFEQEISMLVSNNMGLFLCKPIANLQYPEQLFFLICAWRYAYFNDREIELFEVYQLIGQLKVKRLQSDLRSERSVLIKEKLIEEGGGDSRMGIRGVYTLGAGYRKRMRDELGLVTTEDEDEDFSGLKRFKDIKEKHLYFNPDEEQHVFELQGLLDNEKFQDIQRRLAENGMRQGFACLFYGAPGTGKTETVLQLARMSGRDIMEVNVTDIKSKWVGDSEKNIKAIFENYRTLCKNMEKCPILLFNEADAVLGIRNENVQRSVEHMENAIQNIILEEMEKLDGILIATTNLATNLDKAFERRFLYKIEFNKPDLQARANIWCDMIPGLSKNDAEILAGKYMFSGGQIENVARKQIVNNILYNEGISLEKLEEYCELEILVDNRRTVVGF